MISKHFEQTITFTMTRRVNDQQYRRVSIGYVPFWYQVLAGIIENLIPDEHRALLSFPTSHIVNIERVFAALWSGEVRLLGVGSHILKGHLPRDSNPP